ncbi:MAG: hypothetical protein R3349_11940 [Geminicoccaceae bacterium]|nr:hypothetical protein [Geminicoccaceae bacterium]
MVSARRHFPAIALAVLLGGCASIVSDSENTIPISSNPAGAELVITDQTGAEIYRGTTPATVTLDTGAGYFDGEAYTITMAMNGYAAQTVSLGTELNGWYVGNIVFGGPIGLLIVDPLTGAMWKLDRKNVSIDLPRQVADADGGDELRIVALGDLPPEARADMVRVN